MSADVGQTRVLQNPWVPTVGPGMPGYNQGSMVTCKHKQKELVDLFAGCSTRPLPDG